MIQKLILTFMIVISLSTGGWTSSPAKTDDQKNKPNTKAASAATTGDDVFQANCSRCHAPPMSISPRATGAVIMHMRTRARLSREDEVKLLRFMAP